MRCAGGDALGKLCNSWVLALKLHRHPRYNTGKTERGFLNDTVLHKMPSLDIGHYIGRLSG